MKKVKQSILRLLGNFFLKSAINLLCKSLKIEKINQKVIDELQQSNQNYVLAFWHSTMLLPWYVHRDQNFAALTSLSKDGDLLARQLKSWNYKVVRGSSSKGGDIALGIMVDLAKNKYSIAITPDGPKGPVRQFKAGAVVTAKKSGIPVVLAGVGFSKKRKLKSWDSFEVPKFFSRAKIVYSEPIFVNSELSYEETSEIIKKCEQMLNKLQDSALNL
ncbi:MAG: lysophospholipid acyltransferase family protein [Ignavibacterium sp.]|uniref:lysophospholipid acyltransferase family protein n=1 Tax=Ignavibacterium sp. TaxID=2651167 RepID=UPI0040493D55